MKMAESEVIVLLHCIIHFGDVQVSLRLLSLSLNVLESQTYDGDIMRWSSSNFGLKISRRLPSADPADADPAYPDDNTNFGALGPIRMIRFWLISFRVY